MKKTYIIAIIAILIAVLIIGVVWAQQSSKQDQESTAEPTATQPSEENNTQTPGSEDEVIAGQTITYDGSGFSPSSLTISQGDTVTFRNQSSAQVWPASDDHPTHTNLSGFDSQRGLEQGAEYSYTFDTVGEWGYHNHLSPSQTGTIIVQ